MATLAGSVSIDGAGVATGAGMAKTLYDLFIATPAYSVIVVNPTLGYTVAAVVAARRQLADLVNTMAAIADGPRWIPTGFKTSNYNAAPWELVMCNPSGGAFFVTLPNAAAVQPGTSVAVKNTTASTNSITVNSFGGSIDNISTFVMAAAGACCHFTSNGSNWFVSANF
jgi:hypothetical protein